MMNTKGNPLVSIITLAYNHEHYLRECLIGIINQKTSFNFELIIHEDASTDGTKAIIEEFEEKYPSIVKPVYQDENQFSKGVKIGMTYLYPRARGKYIALCEGDDYWTDPDKLQKQVDFLEANPDYSMCFHNAVEIWEEGAHKARFFSKIENKDYTATDIYNRWILPTASTVFKKEVVMSRLYLENIAFNPDIYFGDIALFMSCCQFGKVRGFLDVMSVYRRHSRGVTSKISNLNIQLIYCTQGFIMSSIFSANKELANLMVSKSIKRTMEMYWSTVFLCNKEYKQKCSKLIKENSKGHILLILMQSPIRFYMALRNHLKRRKEL